MCSLLVLEKEVESRLNLCRPKDTSSLEGVLRTPMGPLVELCVRPRREYFIADGVVPFSDPPPLWPGKRAKENSVTRNYTTLLYTRGYISKLY